MRLDIVIPAHNEQDRIDRTLHAYRSQVSQGDVRFIVAMDHCTDATGAVVARHARLDPRVEAWAYPKLGKGGVIMEAFRHCDADLVAFIDADCATPPAELHRLVQAVGSFDGAVASRRHPASVVPAPRPLARKLASTVFATGIRAVFGLPNRDTQCGAKVLRRHVLSDVVPLLSSRDFLFDVDLLLTAAKLGFRIVEVPTVWVDQAGSHLGAGGDGLRMAASAFRLWVHHRVLPVPSSPRSRPANPRLASVAPVQAGPAREAGRRVGPVAEKVVDLGDAQRQRQVDRMWEEACAGA